jgi:glycosyltransferase involved in cell wall biosynthesis
MHVVQLAHYPAPYPGSFVPMLRAALRAVRRRGWSAEVVLADDAAGRAWVEQLRSEAEVRLVPVDSRRRLRRELAALLEPGRPTILHTHFTAFDAPAALEASRRPDVRVVWHLHSPPRSDLAGRLRNLAKFSTLGRRVDRILCVAPDLAEAARRRGAPGERVEFFPNAIDTNAFRPPTPSEREVARRELGLEGDEPVLVHFGWDWKRKGGDVFVEAVSALEEEGRRVVAVTVGAPEQALGVLQASGVPSSLRVAPLGERPQRLYAAADVFVSPSRAEGMPFAMLEALASGVPVAASDIPGQAVMGRGLGACRLTPLDPIALAAAIGALLDRGPAEAARDAAAARERVRAQLDLEPWAERLAALYERLGRQTSTSVT